MGNTVKRATDYLRDPFLVRRIQEAFGVQQVFPSSDGEESETQSSDAGSDGESPTVFTSSAFDSKPKSNGGVSVANGGLMNGWLASKAKKRYRLKALSSAAPGTSPPSSPEVEDAHRLPEVVVESLPLLDAYFRLATAIGYEPFYITILPFLCWIVDTLLFRRLVLLWCMSMYVGQACKALFRWKRPASPPALRLERNPNLETEFGFPSTHAIVATTFPFYFVYVTFGRFELPLWLGLTMAIAWSSSVCTSRIYLGVHTVMDVLGGILISLAIFILAIPGLHMLDHYILYVQYTGISALLLVIFLLYVYPVDPHKWTMDRGDTGAILGVGLGAVLAFNLHGPFPDDIDPGPFIVSLPSLHMVWMSLLRFVVGILLILPTRFVMKLLCFKLLPAIMPTHGVQEVVRRPLVELPYKIITYGAIGFNIVYLAPIVFEICDIGRFEGGTYV